MQINREKVVKLLEQQGRDDAASRAATELPERFDPHVPPHADLLRELGVDSTRLAPDVNQTPRPPADQ